MAPHSQRRPRLHWHVTVTGGTGIFNNATGSGTATFMQQPGSTTALGGAINASKTFTSLTVHI